MYIKNFIFFTITTLFFHGCNNNTVKRTNHAPIIQLESNLSVIVNQSITIRGEATDSDGEIISYSWKKGSTLLTNSDLLNYSPTTIGVDTLTFTVTDNEDLSVSEEIKIIVNPTPIPDFFKEFNIGFGGSYSFPFISNIEGEKIWMSSVDLVMDENIENNSYYNDIKFFDPLAFDALQKQLTKSKFLVYWLPEDWEKSWFDVSKIQQAMDAGYIPVFNYWYFGDKLLDEFPSASTQEAYATNNQQLIDFFNELNGTKLLIMEPEFNKATVLENNETQHAFAKIISDAIDRIENNTSNTYFSLAMTDNGSRDLDNNSTYCGYENCSLGDKYSWEVPSIIYSDLDAKLDFISFQEMVAQFSRDPSNPGTWDNPIPKALTEIQSGIDNLAKRIANFSQFLQEKYQKPIFLPYITIATATWDDNNSNGVIDNEEVNLTGWEEKANTLYAELSLKKNELKEKGLFGLATMALFDNPAHDKGGYQYFMNNEYHLGIIKSSSIDDVDIATTGDIEPKGTILSSLFD